MNSNYHVYLLCSPGNRCRGGEGRRARPCATKADGEGGPGSPGFPGEWPSPPGGPQPLLQRPLLPGAPGCPPHRRQRRPARGLCSAPRTWDPSPLGGSFLWGLLALCGRRPGPRAPASVLLCLWRLLLAQGRLVLEARLWVKRPGVHSHHPGSCSRAGERVPASVSPPVRRGGGIFPQIKSYSGAGNWGH